MLKLFALLLLLSSCQGSRNIPATAEVFPVLEKWVLLEAASQSAASDAQTIIHVICPPGKVDITDQGQGSVLLSFHFRITVPLRFNQMMDQLAQVPGITILKEQ